MDSRWRDDFLINALAILSADVFFHPLWLHAAIKDPGEAWRLAGDLAREIISLTARQDWLNACRVCLAQAYLLNLSGRRAEALETLCWVDQTARRSGLIAAAVWAGWGASAVCAQAGDYAQAAEHLSRLQQDLYRGSQWILADVIELVLQTIEEWITTRDNTRRLPPNPDRPGLLLEQMFCWGKPPAEIAGNVPAAAEELARTYVLIPSYPAPNASGTFKAQERTFWQTLLKILRGELRLGLVEASKPGAEPKTQPLPAMIAPRHERADLDKMVPSDLKAPAENQSLPFIDMTAAPELPVELPAVTGREDGESTPDSPPPAEQLESLQPPGSMEAGVKTVIEEPGLPLEPAPARLTIVPEAQTDPVPLLSVCLLDSFSVKVGDIAIEDWPSGRSRAVFAYLLAHHAHPVPREVLMETFWPEAPLDSARNNLNVAVYTLRHTLKALLKTQVILLNAYSAYQINPDLQLWVDSEAFEQHVRDARSHESAGAVSKAISAYQEAVNLYQGDFLADAPFEGWATLERERLRVLYLEALDRLSMLYFNQGQYKTCIDLCQRILSHDACREDAHRRLMQCYARQGQASLALRQFQACVEALREELEVPPSLATVQLYEQIKRQEMV